MAAILQIAFFNILRPRQNGPHVPDDIFKCIFVNESVLILIKISLKFVPKGPTNNIPALVQIMAWCWPGDKPLWEPMMDSLLMHICVTLPQWVKGIILEGRIYILFKISLKLVPGVPVKNKSMFIQVMACCRTGIKLFIESMLIPPKLQWIANWCPASLEFVHYSGITGVSWSLKSETTGLFVQWLVQANIKETPTLCITGHFEGNKFVDSNLMVVVLDWSKREMITFFVQKWHFFCSILSMTKQNVYLIC